MSDHEWDRLLSKLSSLESETSIIYADSPTQKVGYAVRSQLQKVKHVDPLLSLGKTKLINNLYDFMNGQRCLLMYKLDGLTVEITYEGGILTRAETRGNGEVGELITHNALTFINVPKVIPYKQKLRVVGEAIITYPTFNKINDVENTEYKNPRNLCSGTVRQLDSRICANREVRFYVFRVNEGVGLGAQDSKHEHSQL